MRDRLEPETIRTEAEGDIIVGEVEQIKDAAFIAAANPATVLKLIEAARKATPAAEPALGGDEPQANAPSDVAGARERLLGCLRGPHEWGYRCPVEGGFVADDRPYQAADEIQRQGEEIERLLGALETVRQSLKDQAAARHDPTMPLLVPEVVESLRENAEAQWALSDDRSDRVEAHGLSLLCDWQDAARARQGGPDHG